MKLSRGTGMFLAFVMVAIMCVVPVEAAREVRLVVDGRVVHKGTKGETTIEGGARIFYGDTVITSSNAVVNMNTNTAVLSGGVSLVQGDVTLTADTMNVNMKQDTAAVKGNIKLTKREQQQEKDAQGKPVFTIITMTCDNLNISTATQDFTAEGRVSIVKDKQKAQADKAVYGNAAKTLTLTGAVNVTGEKDERIKCDKATLHTDKELLEAEGKPIEITFTIED